MKIDSKNYIYNKNDYLTKFNHQLNLKKVSNKSSKDTFNMSYKRPIPISNYDYSLFNFLPKMQKEIYIKDFFNNNINKRYFYRYISGKIISELYWDDFIYFLIKDKNDDIIAISVFHFEDKLYPLNLEQIQKEYLSIGKYILIINPFYTYENYYQIIRNLRSILQRVVCASLRTISLSIRRSLFKDTQAAVSSLLMPERAWMSGL